MANDESIKAATSDGVDSKWVQRETRREALDHAIKRPRTFVGGVNPSAKDFVEEAKEFAKFLETGE